MTDIQEDVTLEHPEGLIPQFVSVTSPLPV